MNFLHTAVHENVKSLEQGFWQLFSKKNFLNQQWQFLFNFQIFFLF